MTSTWQAYNKAKDRAVAHSGDSNAVPHLWHSHDEACADSCDGERVAWLKANQSECLGKGNSGKKIMAAEFVNSWCGALRLTDEQFAEAQQVLCHNSRDALS